MTVAQLGDTESLGRPDPGQEDERIRQAGAEALDEGFDAAADQVVAQVHHERLGLEVVPRLPDRVGEAERRALPDVGDPRAEAAAVTHGGGDFAGRVAHDHADLGQARADHALDRIKEDGLVGHRHELLGAGVSDRAQAGARPAAQDEGFQGMPPDEAPPPRPSPVEGEGERPPAPVEGEGEK